jgi:peptidoglycan hydrolase-like protein with peptidoglycan-binding domain
MRKLILTTVSVLALGTAAAGIGHAGQPPVKSVTIEHGNTPPGAVNRVMIQQGTQQGLPTKRALNLSFNHIKRVQQQLKADHLYNGPINGQMDLRTRRAIARFQQQHHLLPSGTVDLQTLDALDGLTNGVGSTELPGTRSSSSGFTGVNNPNLRQPGVTGNGTAAPNTQGR